MDFVSVLILVSIIFFALLLSIGPFFELKGKILFEKERDPVIKGRFGMGLMVLSMVLFVTALIMRIGLSSATVTPYVMGGYLLWIIGGVIAVIRNEMLAFMIPDEENHNVGGKS